MVSMNLKKVLSITKSEQMVRFAQFICASVLLFAGLPNKTPSYIPLSAYMTYIHMYLRK